MSEKFARSIMWVSIIIAVFLGIVLTVAGGISEGWYGVGITLAGQGVFIILLYLYNRKYK